MAYDPACEDLARHFLGDRVSTRTIAELAQHVQTTVEDWIEYQLNEREKTLVEH